MCACVRVIIATLISIIVHPGAGSAAGTYHTIITRRLLRQTRNRAACFRRLDPNNGQYFHSAGQWRDRQRESVLGNSGKTTSMLSIELDCTWNMLTL